MAVVVIWQMRPGGEAAADPAPLQASPVQLSSEAPAETTSMSGNNAGEEEVQSFLCPPLGPESLLKSFSPRLTLARALERTGTMPQGAK